MKKLSLISLLSLAGLAACGGGGSGGDASTPSTTSATPTAPPVPGASATVASLIPAAGMTWATSAPRELRVVVLHADGTPAAGAAVRLFALSRTSPQDRATLESPVPVSLLDSGVTDGSGRAVLAGPLPAHLSEVLWVATDGAEQGQLAVPTDSAAEASLRLAR